MTHTERQTTAPVWLDDARRAPRPVAPPPPPPPAPLVFAPGVPASFGTSPAPASAPADAPGIAPLPFPLSPVATPPAPPHAHAHGIGRLTRPTTSGWLYCALALGWAVGAGAVALAVVARERFAPFSPGAVFGVVLVGACLGLIGTAQDLLFRDPDGRRDPSLTWVVSALVLVLGVPLILIVPSGAVDGAAARATAEDGPILYAVVRRCPAADQGCVPSVAARVLVPVGGRVTVTGEDIARPIVVIETIDPAAPGWRSVQRVRVSTERAATLLGVARVDLDPVLAIRDPEAPPSPTPTSVTPPLPPTPNAER